MTTKEEIVAAFGKAVKKQLGEQGAVFGPDGKATNLAAGWGGKDSVAVIQEIADAAYLGDSPEGFDGIAAYVLALVNPSAFRQSLEAKGLVRKTEKGTRAGKADLLAGI